MQSEIEQVNVEIDETANELKRQPEYKKFGYVTLNELHDAMRLKCYNTVHSKDTVTRFISSCGDDFKDMYEDDPGTKQMLAKAK